MKLKLLSVAAAFALFLSGCTLTIMPAEDETPVRQTEPGRVTTPVQSGPVPTTPQVVPNFPHDTVITYACSGGRLLVRYTSNESAQIFDAGAWHTLTRTVSADGHFVYRDDTYSWHARRSEGFLLRNGAPHASDCKILS